jgi:hypothetical protein
VKVVEVLGPCFIWRVGRWNVSIWYDKWLENKYLCEVMPYVNISDTNLRLEDMFENEVWNFNMFYTQLPTLYKECIHNIIIDHDIDDKLIWSSSPDGTYSSNQGYIWFNLYVNPLIESTTCWRWIWHLPISENLKHFCWLVMYSSLPTNAFRGLRRITRNTTCYRSGAIWWKMTSIPFVIVLRRCL